MLSKSVLGETLTVLLHEDVQQLWRQTVAEALQSIRQFALINRARPVLIKVL